MSGKDVTVKLVRLLLEAGAQTGAHTFVGTAQVCSCRGTPMTRQVRPVRAYLSVSSVSVVPAAVVLHITWVEFPRVVRWQQGGYIL